MSTIFGEGIGFSNRYLELLGYTDFVTELRETDKDKEFLLGIELFNQYRLGF